MPQITVTIDGKAYRMACEDGQEDHLSSLAARFDRYITHLKGQFGEIGDLRLTVMAGIMITDELAEAGRRIAELESEVAGLRQNTDGLAQSRAQNEELLVQTISDLAGRLNGITRKLAERPAAPAR